MKSKVAHTLRVLPVLALLLALAGAAPAQQPSPSPQKDADATTRGPAAQAPEAGDDFRIVSSIEIGYRGLRVGGDLNKYQSDLNYKAGPRVFDTSLLMQARDGAGRPFDTLLVTTTGWGSDPQGRLRLSVEKSRWYRFEGSYRRFKYFRFLNNIANPNYATRPTDPATGQHDIDTRQETGDFDLTLLPKNERVSFNVGYSPERVGGPAYTTWHYGGDDFMLLSETKWRSHNFRVGADWKLGPVDFSFQQGFRRFREDSYVDNRGVNLGVNPAPSNFLLRSIQRDQPVRGSVNHTRLTAHTLVARRLDISGRFIYSSATTDFDWVETATGNNFNSRIAGIPAAYNPSNTNRTVLTLGRWSFAGDTKRPNTLGDLGVTYLVTENFRVSNTFRAETFQINGGALYHGLFNISLADGTALPPLTPTGYSHEVTKYRKLQNTVEGDYEFNPRYSVRFGYRFGTRRIERFLSGHNLASNGAPAIAPTSHEEENETHAFFGGVKARPVKNWTLSFDAERGTADNVFTRTGNYDYTNVRARSRYQFNRTLRLNLGFITKNNTNPSEVDIHGTTVSLADFGVDVRSRIFTSSVDWAVNPRLSFSGGYNYNWQNSDAVIEYAFGPGVPNAGIRGRSLYFVRNHFFHFDTVAQPFRRVSLYASYRVNKDTGQGDRLSAPAGSLLVTSYPMSFQSPEARVAIRLNRRVDWNLGYQYYNYNESGRVRVESPFVPVRPQNYHAHLPYVSLRFYFGNVDR